MRPAAVSPLTYSIEGRARPSDSGSARRSLVRRAYLSPLAPKSMPTIEGTVRD
jgi:hypothetical protein